MDKIKDGWFSEINALWPGQAMSLQVEEILFHEKSKFQDVIVLIIGGGDGGILREVIKHPDVEQVDQCEIDQMVIDVSKKYLPEMAESFSSPKLNLLVGDGFEFMKKHQGQYDVIITDSSDPVGPASTLFQKSYYELMKTALKPDGILACQGECLWLHLELIKGMLAFCRSLFPVSDYAFTTIPTYPSGQIGFVLCSKNPDTMFSTPVRELSTEDVAQMKLKYYNSDIHRAAFILPEFARKVLKTDTVENGNADQTHNGTN
ncbi:SPEE-like protein [Mya arenaria]|uniref:SPEE-like protein n=1 Tax=Mya arenaria TaxID=6604 RepID=A0ABY7F1U8_MYAAR|nr:SPEE-like protein [Mya arenaria]